MSEPWRRKPSVLPRFLDSAIQLDPLSASGGDETQSTPSATENSPVELTSCPHLRQLEAELRASGITTQYEGPSWWGSRKDSGGQWLYFNCFLDRASLEQRLNLEHPLKYAEYFGFAAGQEAGWICAECDSALMGFHPLHSTQPIFR